MGSAITSDGRTSARLSAGASSRCVCVISAPDSVVGIAAHARPSTAAMALAESMTRPPPSATSGRSPTPARTVAAASGTLPAGRESTASAAAASPDAPAAARGVVRSA